MKLFQRLLVAPAALGLLAPLAANATEVNLNDISNYSDVESFDFAKSFDNNDLTEDQLIAGGEGLVEDTFDGGFSETTSASFSADMAIGAVDGGSSTTDDAVTAVYGFQIDLTTSFTGEDSLDISIDAGNAGSGTLTELDLNDGGTDDALYVDGVSYTFPLGDKITAFFGDNTDGSLLFSTACVYGGPTNTLDDCGNANSAITGGDGTAAGASFDIGNGFTGAFGYTGSGSSTKGLLTAEGLDAFAGQVSYAADSYGLSVTYANVETLTVAGEVNTYQDETSYWGFNGYWTPSDSGSMPSISVGYEVGDPTPGRKSATEDKDTSHYFVGLQWDEAGPGTFGAALGTKTPTVDGATELMMYEAFYSYDINDGMTITPLIYVKENSGSTDDETGVMVKTSFSF